MYHNILCRQNQFFRPGSNSICSFKIKLQVRMTQIIYVHMYTYLNDLCMYGTWKYEGVVNIDFVMKYVCVKIVLCNIGNISYIVT